MSQKNKILQVLLGVSLLLVAGGIYYHFNKSMFRVLVFEHHDPLRKDLSDADFKDLFQMHQDCFLEPKRKNLPLYLMKYQGFDSVTARKKTDSILERTSKDQEKYFGEIENAFVMRDRGQIIGLFNCREEKEATHGSMMIWNVCVRKELRGQGYGKELMMHALDKCTRPGKDITLVVYKYDTKVVDFYKDLEFEIISNLDEWDHDFNFFNKYLMKYKSPPLMRDDRQE